MTKPKKHNNFFGNLTQINGYLSLASHTIENSCFKEAQ